MRHTIRVRLPHPGTVTPEEVRVNDPAFRFESAVRAAGNEVTLTYSYTSLADHVPVPALETYLTHLDDARRHLSHAVDPQAPRGRGTLASGAAAGAVVLVALVWYARRRRATRGPGGADDRFPQAP